MVDKLLSVKEALKVVYNATFDKDLVSAKGAERFITQVQVLVSAVDREATKRERKRAWTLIEEGTYWFAIPQNELGVFKKKILEEK